MEYTSQSPLYVRSSEKMQGKCDVIGDHILPDNYEDIRRILHAGVCLTPDRAELSAGKLVSEGKLTLTVLFEDDNGSVGSVDFTRDYQVSCSTDKSELSQTLLCMPSVDSVSVRLINPRKIGARITLDTNAKIWGEQSVSLELPEAFTASDRMSVERREESGDQLCIEVLSDGTHEVSEDIELERGMQPIDRIIMSDLSVDIDEVRRSGNGLTLKGTLSLLVLYRDVEGTLACKRAELPFAREVETSLSGDYEQCEYAARVYIDKKSVVAGENAFGESKVIELDFSCTVNVCVFNNCKFVITSDAYSTDYMTENVMTDYRYSALLPSFNENQSRSVEGECEEGQSLVCVIPEKYVRYEDNSPKAIVRLACLMKNASGKYSVTVLEDSFPIGEGVNAEMLADMSLTLGQCSCEAGVLRVQYSARCRALAWENKECSALSALALAENTEGREPKALTVYYPQKGETLWDVAKKYRISESVLMSCNAISDPAVMRGVLLIPKKRKASFSKII